MFQAEQVPVGKCFGQMDLLGGSGLFSLSLLCSKLPMEWSGKVSCFS